MYISPRATPKQILYNDEHHIQQFIKISAATGSSLTEMVLLLLRYSPSHYHYYSQCISNTEVETDDFASEYFPYLPLVGASCKLAGINSDSRGLSAAVFVCESLGMIVFIFLLLEMLERS